MKTKTKNTVFAVLVVLFIVVCAGWMIFGGAEHIEDKNGPDNSSLAVITDKDIAERKITAVGLGEKTSITSDLITYHSKKYSGVYLLEAQTIWVNTGMTVTLYNAELNAGNFCVAVVMDGKVIHKFEEFGEVMQSYTFTETGEFALVIAGESADFELSYDIH